jgi:hypothetical protein
MDMTNNGWLSYMNLSKINRMQKCSSDIYAIWYNDDIFRWVSDNGILTCIKIREIVRVNGKKETA